jgi:hypothetical protein
MKRRLLALVAFCGLVSVGFLLSEEISARSTPANVIERRVSANLVQVRVDGNWQDVPLMPLSEHACTSGDPHLQRYCD